MKLLTGKDAGIFLTKFVEFNADYFFMGMYYVKCIVTGVVIFVHFKGTEYTSRVLYTSLTIFLGSVCQVS